MPDLVDSLEGIRMSVFPNVGDSQKLLGESFKVGFHPLNDRLRSFQGPIERLYSIDAQTFRWSD